MTTETKALYEKRGQLVTKMQEIVSKAKSEDSRSLTKEEDAQWSKLDTEQESILSDIRRIEKLADLTASEKERFLQTKGKDESVDSAKDKENKRVAAFTDYLVRGFNGMKNENRELLRAYQNVGTTTEGGFLVPEGFSNELAKSLLKTGGVRQVARVLRTATGNDIPWPNMNDTANSAAILAESTTALTTPDLVFGSTTLKAWKYATSVIRVSKELMQDSAINIQSVVMDALAERMARGTNAGFTTGNGTTAPEGVVTGSGAGVTSASETAITASELIDLEHSLDIAYRANAKFMMHDSILKKIKQLVLSTNDNQPIWNPGIMQSGMASTILGYEYVINNDMASSLVADAKVILFGDFSYYIVRDVLDFSVLTLNERYAEYLQTGYIGFGRFDGRYISSDDTVKRLTMINT